MPQKSHKLPKTPTNHAIDKNGRERVYCEKLNVRSATKFSGQTVAATYALTVRADAKTYP
jgi:hypothetical protein